VRELKKQIHRELRKGIPYEVCMSLQQVIDYEIQELGALVEEYNNYYAQRNNFSMESSTRDRGMLAEVQEFLSRIHIIVIEVKILVYDILRLMNTR
jgi:uncharacterized HAD superfamily protein